jgi:hypothetical protein
MDQRPPPYNEAVKSGMYPNPNASSGETSHGNPTAPGFQSSYQPNLGSSPYPNSLPSAQPTYVYVSEPNFGPRAIRLTCPHCQQEVVTRIKYTAGLLTWLLSGGCLLFG